MAGSVIVSGARTPIGKLSGSLAGFSGAQLGGWLTEWGVAPGPVTPMSIQQVAPGVPVDGPAPELEDEVRALHARLHGRA